MSMKETFTTMWDMVLWRLGLVRRSNHMEQVMQTQRLALIIKREELDNEIKNDI